MAGRNRLGSFLDTLFGNPRPTPSDPVAPTQAAKEPLSQPPARFRQAVAGESFHQDALAAICGGHNRYGHWTECTAHLVREPTNPHDANAVRVEIAGKLVGYLPGRKAASYALSAPKPKALPESVPAVITGGWRTNQHDAGHFGVRLAL